MDAVLAVELHAGAVDAHRAVVLPTAPGDVEAMHHQGMKGLDQMAPCALIGDTVGGVVQTVGGGGAVDVAARVERTGEQPCRMTLLLRALDGELTTRGHRRAGVAAFIQPVQLVANGGQHQPSGIGLIALLKAVACYVLAIAHDVHAQPGLVELAGRIEALRPVVTAGAGDLEVVHPAQVPLLPQPLAVNLQRIAHPAGGGDGEAGHRADDAFLVEYLPPHPPAEQKLVEVGAAGAGEVGGHRVISLVALRGTAS